MPVGNHPTPVVWDCKQHIVNSTVFILAQSQKLSALVFPEIQGADAPMMTQGADASTMAQGFDAPMMI